MDQNFNDPLWRIAKKRAGFKRTITAYLIINSFFWIIWWITQGRYGWGSWPSIWPIWPMLGWGIGLAFQYFDAYGSGDKQSAIEREYEKLKKEQQ